MKKILIVEDDLALSSGLCFELDTSGYLTSAAYTLEKADRLLKEESFHLVLLDVNLPDGNGFDLCKKIKADFPEIPVIFLTANDMDKDVINGFDLGADDYITKPFHTQILKRRIEVALRRGCKRRASGDYYDDGWLRLDFAALTAIRGNETLSITPNEYKLLCFLIANAGRLVTRRLLMEKLWDSGGNFIDDHSLTVAMNRLRGKIEDDGHSYIQTIRGMGYIWTGEKI
ncbi:MAG: response regulator transcription factor [Dorea sp.]|nr:response regulator transcription factor [Dorea sp.]